MRYIFIVQVDKGFMFQDWAASKPLHSKTKELITETHTRVNEDSNKIKLAFGII